MNRFSDIFTRALGASAVGGTLGARIGGAVSAAFGPIGAGGGAAVGGAIGSITAAVLSMGSDLLD